MPSASEGFKLSPPTLDPGHRAKGYAPSRRYRLALPRSPYWGEEGGLADVSYAYAYFTALFNDVSLASTYTYNNVDCPSFV